MSGLVKAKKYDWKDSNMALFGSDTEKSVKKESAQCEPAWSHAGQKVGLQIWRIVKFKVVAWPTEDYGKFFSGDSYIILNTYYDEEEATYKEQDTDQLLFDVHFWIGKYSTQDEYGTAAYKTVELDTFLDDVPVQHREVQGHESPLFKSYFPHIQIMKGGADTGFRHVKPEEYETRLFHVSGTRSNVTVKQVPMRKDKVTSGDVFILDKGLEIYQWNGKSCNKDEKFKAVQFLQTVKSDRRGKCTLETLEEEDVGEKFFDLFDHEDEDDDDDDDDDEVDGNKTPALFKLSDEGGELQFNHCKDGRAYKADFSPKDVFIYDTKAELFVWIGSRASASEKKNALGYGHKYLQSTAHPLLPITCVKQGKENKSFRVAISA